MGTVFHSVWSDFGDFSMRFFNAGPCANPGAPLARTEALLLRLHCNASPTRSPPSVATRHLPPRGTNYCCFSGAFRVCGESEALLFEASRTQAPLKRNSSPPPIRGRWRGAPEGALREPRRRSSATVVLPRFGGGGAKRRRGRCANPGAAGTSSLQRLANSQPPFCRYATSSPKGGRITVASAGRFGFAGRARLRIPPHHPGFPSGRGAMRIGVNSSKNAPKASAKSTPESITHSI